MKDLTEYKKFLRSHARKDLINIGFWTVTKPIKAFKKIYTYTESNEKNVIIHPHWASSHSYLHVSEFFDQYTAKYQMQDILSRKDAAIANIIIPSGASLFMDFSLREHNDDYGKLRASRAEVHSIVRINDRKPVVFGVSGWDQDFIYTNTKMIDGFSIGKRIEVQPSLMFSYRRVTCAPGIHFFLELDAALNY